MLIYFLQSIAAVAVVECLLLSSALTGLSFFISTKDNKPVGLEALLVGLGIGVFILSYTIFGLAVFQALNTFSLIMVISCWLLIGSWLGWQYRAKLKQALNRLDQILPGHWWIWIVLILLACAHLLPALMPLTDWDGVAYHMALPKIYLQHGGFVFRPDIFHNLFPQFMEMLYTLGLLSPYGIGAKIIHFEFGLLSALAVLVLARRLQLNYFWSGLAMLLFYSQYIIHIESGTAFIELGWVFFSLLAIIVLSRLTHAGSEDKTAAWLGMFFLGITAAIKWHGLVLLTLGFIWVLTSLYKQKKYGYGLLLKKVVLLGLAGLLPVLPYFIRAYLTAGNPVWPLAYNLFGGQYWDGALAEKVSAIHATYAGLAHDWKGLLRLPYDLIVNSKYFSVGANEFRLPLIGTALLAIGVMISQGSRRTVAFLKQHVVMMVLTIIYIVIWFKSSPQFRFLLPLLPLWSVMMIIGLKTLWSNERLRFKVLAITAGVLMIAFHPPVHRNTPDQMTLLLGFKSPDRYCSESLDHYKACRFLNRFAGPREKILLFGENRGFYLDGPYIWGDPSMQKIIDYRKLADSDGLAEKLKQLNVTWVLYRTDLYNEDYYPAEIKEMMQQVLTRFGEPLYTNDPVKVFKLNFSNYARIDTHKKKQGEVW